MVTDKNELLWEHAIDDAACTGDYTLADSIALQAKLAREKITDEQQSADAEDDRFSELYHSGLIEYMRQMRYDQTYVIMANAQNNFAVAFAATSNPQDRKSLQDDFDRYVANNRQQMEKTNAIRREYTGTLIAKTAIKE
jgi:hypothetical protein